MKKAIITGATGMLGIALIKKLIAENMSVTAVVRPNSKRAGRVPKNKNVEIVECDLENLSELSSLLDGKYDYFFHFGWDGTYGDNRNNMSLQIKNIEATLSAVEAAHVLGCEVFVGAGSQAEFGRTEGKLSADTKTNPETGYGIAKLCAGQMSRVQCSKYGIHHVWMRILSTYGPNDGMHTMVMSGIKQMLNHERPQYTKGEQMWDYLYCGDAANAFYLAAVHGKDGAVYCLGGGKVRPLADYIKDIRDVVSPDSEIGFGEIPYYENQVMYLCADIEDLTKDTGFQPMMDFKEGIRITAEWLKEELGYEEN